jgi:hypothetical protein
MEATILIKIIIRWLLVAISLGAGSCVIYYFFSDVFKIKKRNCFLLTTFIVAIFVLIYIDSRDSHTVRMKEDVLYIKPVQK